MKSHRATSLNKYMYDDDDDEGDKIKVTIIKYLFVRVARTLSSRLALEQNFEAFVFLFKVQCKILGGKYN